MAAGQPIDLQTALGATTGASATRFSFFLPDMDRDGQPVPELEQWIGVAMALFADINGGATRLPVAQGISKPDGGGETVRETTVLFSFVRRYGERPRSPIKRVPTSRSARPKLVLGKHLMTRSNISLRRRASRWGRS